MMKSKKKSGRHSASFDDSPSYSSAPYTSTAHTSTTDASAYSRHGNAEQYQNAAKKQKKSRKRRIGLRITAVLLVLVLVGAGAAFAYLYGIEKNLKNGLDQDLYDSLVASDSPSDPFYMLLIGVDKSEDREESNVYGGAYRTDSMILTRVDPQNKKVTLVSIYRDTRVDLKGHGQQKINAAYAFGGPALAVKTVSELAGVPIHHYAEIDFNGFQKVVDEIGGIVVDVPMDIDDPAAGAPLKAGEQFLNGAQALTLARSRHAYDDYGDGDSMRAGNQRMILTAILKKIMTSDVATMTNSVNILANYISTDFSLSSILGFANTFKDINIEEDVYSAMEPTVPLFENEIWWQIVDEGPWREMMKRVDAGLPPTEEALIDPNTGVVLAVVGDGGVSTKASSSSAASSLNGVSVAVRNGAGIAGCAGAAAAKLDSAGATTNTGNADNYKYNKTIVIYENDADKATAQKIADILGVGQIKKNSGGTYSFTTDFLVVVGGDWK